LYQGYLSSTLWEVDGIQGHGKPAQTLSKLRLDGKSFLQWNPKVSRPRYQIALEEVIGLDAVEDQAVAQLFERGDIVIHSLEEHSLVHGGNPCIHEQTNRFNCLCCQLAWMVELCHQIKRGAVELFEHGDQFGCDPHRIRCRHPCTEADDQVGPLVSECSDHSLECLVRESENIASGE